jgi:hypothetical protein
MIKVSYGVTATRYNIQKKLNKLAENPVMSLDTETSGVYPKQDRSTAQKLLDKDQDLSIDQIKQYRMVAGNSGLSFPSLVVTTHFIFGLSKDHSEILIPDTIHTEMLIWKFIAYYKGLLLIHNALFDLQIMYNRVHCFPQNYVDTSLMSKCFINHVDIWKAKVGLKELMKNQYDPTWSLYDEYEPNNPKNPKFLKYCSIDGAATFNLWEEIEDHRKNEEEIYGTA